jgi:WD40 repeat protein
MVHLGEFWIECPLKPVFIFPVQAGVSCQWVDDSKHLLLEHFEIIRNSPSQIYHSLLFSPPSSWLHEYYGAELSGAIKVVRGLPDKWGAFSHRVGLASSPMSLACWKDTLAVGLESGDIIILNTITGSHMAVLSGHKDIVGSLAFSSDGTSLASGSDDYTLKLWDVQTGGVVKTFHGHTNNVFSVSISADCTTIASGSEDKTVCLWDIQTGVCHQVTRQEQTCGAVFSPTVPKNLILGSTTQDWDIEGYQICYIDGSGAAFSSDGTHFISHHGTIATVQNSNSGATVAKCETPTNSSIWHSCLSPNGSLVAAAVMIEIYIWDIAGSDPLLIEIITAHNKNMSSLAFISPTTLISGSWDDSVKFWQIGIPTNPATGDSQFVPSPSAQVWTVSLQAESGIAISCDSDGVVRVWDISTGLCNALFQTPATIVRHGDAQMIDGRLIFAWIDVEGLNIWDTNECKLLHSWDGGWDVFCDLRMSGDGSKIFCLVDNLLQVWSTQTGEVVGGMEWENVSFLDPLCVDGSKIWVNFKDKPAQGWDFGVPGSSPVLLSNTPSGRPHLHLIIYSNTVPRIEDTITGKVVFWLSGRYAKPEAVRWDGQYLVAGYESGEVLILDFKHLCSE